MTLARRMKRVKRYRPRCRVGSKYGKLTVMKIAGRDKQGARLWVCQCDCGSEPNIVFEANLIAGKSKSCGCSRGIKNEIGNKYGLLTVYGRAGNTQKGAATWLCRCKCGKTDIIISGYKLRRGDRKSCGCKGRSLQRPGDRALNKLYLNYKHDAKRRKIIFKLTKKVVAKITKQNCHYCGLPPQQIKKHPSSLDTYIYNGIDRIDNNKGYIKDNIVPCCKICNMAKRSQTREAFLAWIERVHNHQKDQVITTPWYKIPVSRLKPQYLSSTEADKTSIW